MKKNAGKVMADLLAGYGVDTVFGIPGGQTLPLYYGIMDNAPKMKHVLMRDENNAVFAADAYARISNRLGVCDSTAGCGPVKYLSGLAEAMNSSSPVLAISAEMSYKELSSRYRGGGAQLVDAQAIVKPVTKWTGRLPHADSVAELTQFAARQALSGRPGPVYIECPWDLFDDEYNGADYEADKALRSVPAYRTTALEEDIIKALNLLKSAKNPLILVGGGAWISGAKEEITRFVEIMGIPVGTSLSGKGIVDETNPFSIGVASSLGGSKFAEKMALEADVIFAIGYKFSQMSTYGYKLPVNGQRIIHLDLDAVELGKMSATDIGLNGDAKATIAMMIELSGETETKDVPVKLVDAKKKYLDERAASITEENLIIPQQVVSILNEICDENTILACDASFSCGWAATYFDVYGNRRTLMPRGMSGLGYGLPSGIGAAAARPNASVVVLTGDGGLNYCLGELQTLHEQSMNVKVIVLNNKTLGWIKWYQAAVWDGRFTEVDTMRNDYAMIARGSGIKGYNLKDSESLKEDMKKILSEPGPALVDIITTETEACKFTDNGSAVSYINNDHKNK